MNKVMLSCNTIPNVHTDIAYPVLASGKIDGIRMCVQEGQAVSRSLKPMANHMLRTKHSTKLLDGLDGELTVANSDWNSFNVNSSAIMTQGTNPSVLYHVFDDMLNPAQASTRKSQTHDRVKQLQDAGWEHLRFCEQHLAHNAMELLELYDSYRARGYEGLIVMKPSGHYKNGRSTLLQQLSLKLKPQADAEAVVVGFEELMHNLDAGNSKCAEHLVPGNKLGALIVEFNGQTFNIGTGFDDYMRNEVWINKHKYIGQLVTFKYMELYPSGVPRGPVFKGFRSKLDV
ncbi:putative DNA ligase-product DNA complex-adenylate [Edwardsiella phage ETP-1]|uniref:DNA ligase n=3 Tax=Kafunavirus KF1 TaxID=1982588 RepID=A0A6G5P4K8_9CAUD|nr:putative DNA ligase-product DNA complex-adenylate [Edwardsiella phage KF-1]QBP07029.1 putative DNA ligase-product DNA complex-adenylate [Edwardsiella phage ETP-1]UIS54085.1 putative DNA ligase-product DNA complex-adenylate [Edwardsiella phage vB_EpP_ZHX]BAM63079.1 putative DNA ligase-product DNA complex-adenylate [Edwardsiella phage KF-1]BAM63128.1 putative DNA ligase-product DNA complex-adenylate [Edwardsiella phage IW-1]